MNTLHETTTGLPHQAEQVSLYAMSVVLITPDCYETLRNTVRALQRQSVKHRVELIIVGSSREILEVPESDLVEFAAYQILEIGEFTSTAAARAVGIQAARSAIVSLMEDHCFPSPTLVEALIECHQEAWTGVGPVFRNANPETATSWAHFLIEYGEFADPVLQRTVEHIPGHNSSYKRVALLEYGEKLAEMLESESPMQWDMGKRGHTFCLEPEAKMHHVNFSTFRGSLELRFHLGRLFAAHRAQQWSYLRRLLYFIGSPLLPIIKLYRIFWAAKRIRLPGGFVRILPILFILLPFDAIGEMIGYIFGAGHANQHISDQEVHRERYLTEDDRKKYFSC